MNKKLVALAVSAIAAGAASAQTANVTLYGVVDTYLANIRSNNGGKSVTVLDAGGLSGSRWGLRGSESLGGGLNAVFTLENGFDSSNAGLGQGGRLFGRQAYVGLTGGFGAGMISLAGLAFVAGVVVVTLRVDEQKPSGAGAPVPSSHNLIPASRVPTATRGCCGCSATAKTGPSRAA